MTQAFYAQDGINLRIDHEDGALYADVLMSDNLNDELNWQIRWTVKWDGCVNWETNPSCMAHLCEPADWDRLHKAGHIAVLLALAAMGDKADKLAVQDWTTLLPKDEA